MNPTDESSLLRASLRNSRAFRWTVGVGAAIMVAIAIVLMFLLTQATNNRELYERNYGRLFIVNMVVAGFLGDVVSGIVSIALLLLALAVGARRLHDIGRSGWWQLLTLTGIGVLVLIYWWVQPSEG